MPSTDPHAQLARLVGSWATEATHVAMPGLVIRGTTIIEWVEGEHFISIRARTDHPQFPNALSILGAMESDHVDERTGRLPTDSTARLRMHYYDERGVFRDFEASIDDTTWRLISDSRDFSQRFTGRFGDDGDTILGEWQMRRDGAEWAKDLTIAYRRQR